LIENICASKARSGGLGSGQTESGAKRGVGEGPCEGSSEGIEVVGRDQQPGRFVLDNLGHSASAGGDDSAPGGHGLDQHEGEGLIGGGGDDDIEGREERGESRDIAEQSDLAFVTLPGFDACAKFSGKSVVVRAGGANEEKFGLRSEPLFDKLPNCIEKEILALEWGQLPEQANGKWSGDSEDTARFVARARPFEGKRIEPVGDDGEAGGEIWERLGQAGGDTPGDGEESLGSSEGPAVERIGPQWVEMVSGEKEADFWDKSCRQPAGGVVPSDVRVEKVDAMASDQPR
jgi:hypothetical protein